MVEGGGILLLIDQQPQEPVDLMELAPPPPVEPAIAEPIAVDAPAPPSGPHIALDENAPEASVPGSFEVRIEDSCMMAYTDVHLFFVAFSTLSTTTNDQDMYDYVANSYLFLYAIGVLCPE